MLPHHRPRRAGTGGHLPAGVILSPSAGPPLIVTLPDEIDITNSAAAFKRVLTALGYPGLLIVDMTGTTFCDCSGLHMLITARDHAKASGSTLRIAINPDSSPARSLAILGMDHVLPVYASIKDATPAQPADTVTAALPAHRMRKAEKPERQQQA